MPTNDRFLVIECDSLIWPSELQISSKRFRLFVAADASRASVEVLSAFAQAALKQGMVYFCAWGPDCQRFEDIVDEDVVGDELDEKLYVGPNRDDVIMTTSHKSDTLDDALDFFVNWAIPTDGFAADSDCWVAVAIDNPEWAKCIRQRLDQR